MKNKISVSDQAKYSLFRINPNYVKEVLSKYYFLKDPDDTTDILINDFPKI